MKHNIAAFDMIPPALLSVAKKVARELEGRGIPYAVIGGLAVSAFAPPRTTKDVDFLIPESHASVVGEFGETTHVSGMHLQGESVPVDGHDVDFMFLPDDMPESMLSAGPVVDGVRVLAPEALIALKLKAGRAKDTGDVVEMVKHGMVDVVRVKKFLKKYVPDQAEDFDSWAELAKFEASRTRSASLSPLSIALARMKRGR